MAGLLEALLAQLAGDPSSRAVLGQQLMGNQPTGGFPAPAAVEPVAGQSDTTGPQRPIGARSVSDFMSGLQRFSQRGGQSSGRALPQDPSRLPGGALAKGGMQAAAQPLAQAGLFVNDREGSPNKGLVGRLMQLEDGRKATEYVDRRGRRRVNVWGSRPTTGTSK